MTKLKEVYKCEVCGNIVEVLHTGVGELVCCGQPMTLLKEQVKEMGYEKHRPIIEKTSNGYKVKVSSIEHPMTKEHHIEWIELIADNVSYIKHLKPGMKPEAEFCLKATKVIARGLCNLHGLWKS